ncbi:MAG: putative transcription regulator protein [Deltaproteobacteria bacterium]|nr:putative transcription regulator protein [Deltaproteobacteria bacterium]
MKTEGNSHHVLSGAAAAAGPSSEAPAGVYTIDQLATAAGVPTRTVRLYQSVGVLDSPQRKGRIAVYSDEHLQRLQLIAKLQDRGLRLRAIRDALRHAQRGKLSIDDWLGLGDNLRTPWSEEAPMVLSEGELREHLGERPAGFIAALTRAGFLRQQGDGLPPTYTVPSPGLLDIGLKLHDAGVDIETSAEAVALIRKRLRRAASDLLAHFLKREGRGFARTRSARDVNEALAALRPAGSDAVRLVFAQEMERALRTAMERGTIPALDRRT